MNAEFGMRNAELIVAAKPHGLLCLPQKGRQSCGFALYAGEHKPRPRAAAFRVFQQTQPRCKQSRTQPRRHSGQERARPCSLSLADSPKPPAPLQPPLGRRVLPPTAPPSLQPQNSTAGRGSGGGHGAHAYSALASPSALCELSPAEKAVDV